MKDYRTFHFPERIRALIKQRIHFWRGYPLFAFLTFAIAAVWIVFGMWFKVLGIVPRHRLIVAAILGDSAAGPVTVLVGIAEIGMALWVLSGLYPRACAAVQTLAIVAMNALEIRLARNLLLAPMLMLCANAIFLVVIWYCALKSSETR